MEVDEIEVDLPRERSNSAGSSRGSGTAGSDEELEPRAEKGAWGKAELFDHIMQECRHNSPGQCFSAKVREETERLDPTSRARLVSRQRHGAAPLFVACARGNLACAEYLLHVCGADLEQRGLFRAPGDTELHRVTPLWAAAVAELDPSDVRSSSAGRLDVLTALADAGADIDAGSDSGSTPLRSACFMTHTAVARFLISRGADVRRANHNGGTCLVNAVQSPELCKLLIDAGAEVDARDFQLKTALHYAVQEHREDAARLLLAAGADPRRATRDGDDALQIAALKGATRIVYSLLGLGFCPARAADAYELLGATQLDEYNDATAARNSWRAATAIRYQRSDRPGLPIPKRPIRPPCPALRNLREWFSLEQLDAHAHDADWMRTQALLVAVRVLGPTHKDTLFRLMYRGAAYADAFRYSRCVALWTWVLELRIRKDTLLHPETCQTLLALTRLLLEARGAGGMAERGAQLSAQRVATDLLRMLVDALPECQRLLAIRPQCRVQGGMFDRALRCVAHLAFIAHSSPPAPEPLEADYRNQIRQLMALELRATATGDTLLHLACSRLNVVRSTYFANDIGQTRSIFPSCSTVRLLLQCGASVTCRNRARCTPLHVAAIPYNFSTELVETLLVWGAHLDQPNRFGDSPAELVQQNANSQVKPLQHVTLACRAARALLKHVELDSAPHLATRLPATLRPFLELHQP